MDFGQPNAENGRKMANGRLLFLALMFVPWALLLILYAVYCRMFVP